MSPLESQAQEPKKAPKSLIRDYLPILMIWNIIFIAEIALHLFLKDDFQYHNDVQKMLFFAQHLKGTTLFLFSLVLTGIPLVCASRLIGNKRVSLVIPILIWPVALFYIASWYGYKIYGQFYTIDILQPLYYDPIQIFQHLFQTMSSWAIALPLAVLVFLFIMQMIVRYLKRRIPDQVVIPYLAANLIICLLLLIGSVGFEHKVANENKLVMDYTSGVARQLEEVYHERVEMQSNPIVTLLYGLNYKFHPSNTATLSNFEYPIERRNRISLAKYLQNVDPREVNRFNIILLLVESLRMDQLTDFGGNVSVMENLEQLERRSIRFIDNYTQASHSNYADLCPLSSHYPLRSRAMYYYPENAPYPKVLIYDILKNIGYKTAIISSQNEKWGNMYNYLKSENLDHFFHSETYKGSKYIPDGDTGFTQFAEKTKMSGKVDDRHTVDEAIRWIDSIGGSPFFIYMNLQNSHVPYPVPADFPRKFSPKNIDFQLRFGDFPRDKIEIVKGMYSDALRYVDFQFGRLIKHLKEKKLMERTIIVVTGDTGQAFFEHGYANHAGPIFDEVMRVPLFFFVPGKQPRTSHRPAQHIDIPPTLISLLNLPPHPSFQGFDLMSSKEFRDRSRFIMVQTPFGFQCGAIRNDLKLIFNPRYRTVRLYNLKEDPDEKTNIANSEPAVMNKMYNLINTWMTQQLTYYEKTSLYTYTYPPFYNF